jgi:hypothetical protein
VRSALAEHAAAGQARAASGREQLAALAGVTRAVSELRARVDEAAAALGGAGAEAGGQGPVEVDERFWAMAERFMRAVAEESGRPVIVCDASGVIVRATDRARIGASHAGARRILGGEALEAVVTAEEAALDPAIREGASCAIVVGGRRVGTFGVTGPLALARPVARVAASVMASRIKEHRAQALLAQAVRDTYAGLDRLAARIGAAAADADRLQGRLGEVSRALSDRLAEAGAVATEVQQVAQQSRMIAVNGAVEAAGSAERARVFGNVARDMMRLADGAQQAARQIGQAIAEVGRAIAALGAATAALERTARPRADAAAAVKPAVAAMHASLDGLLRSFDDDAA